MGREWNGIPLPKGVEVRTDGGREPRISIRFQYKGRVCRELSLAPSRETLLAAERKLGAFLADVQLGKPKPYAAHFPDSPRCAIFGEVNPQGLLVGKLLDEYLAWVRSRVEAVTYDYYEGAIDRHARPFWNDRPATALEGTATVMEWLDDLAEPKRDRKGVLRGLVLKSARNIIIPFNCALDRAVNRGLIPHNPLADLKLHDIWPKKQRTTGYDPDPFDEAERRAIVKIANEEWRDFLLVWWWGGYRPEEIIALKWTEVDFVKERVYICRVNSRGQIEERTKTAASKRFVPLIGPALEAMKRQRARTQLKVKDHGFVFENPVTHRPWKWPQSVSNFQWPTMLKRAGVRHRGPGQNRHTFASIMLAREGINNIGAWSPILGHKHVRITMEKYARMIEEMRGHDTPENKHGFALRNDYSKVAV